MRIAHDYTLSHVGKTLSTALLSSIMTLSYSGGAFGLISKGIAPFITPHLQKAFGVQKINTVVADCISGIATYSAFYTLAKIGFIATPISYITALTITTVSITVTLLCMKVVYVTLSTLFLSEIEGNGKLEKVANYLLQPFRACFISGKGFEGRIIKRLSDETFANEKERINYFTLLIGILAICFAISSVVTMIYSLVGNPEIAKILATITVALDISFLSSFIVGTTIGPLLKIISWFLNPSTFKTHQEVVQWRIRETAPLSTPFRFSEDLINFMQKGYDKNQDNLLLKLPDDALAEIGSRLKQELDLYALFSICRRAVRFSKKYYEDRAEGKRNTILRHFPREMIDKLGGVDAFRQRSFMRMKAHRKMSDIGIPAIQRTYSNKTLVDKCLDCIDPSDMGKATVAWGQDPIPFLAIRVNITFFTFQKTFFGKTFENNVESVALFHPLLEYGSESINYWGFSASLKDYEAKDAFLPGHSIANKKLVYELIESLLAGKKLQVTITNGPAFQIQMKV